MEGPSFSYSSMTFAQHEVNNDPFKHNPFMNMLNHSLRRRRILIISIVEPQALRWTSLHLSKLSLGKHQIETMVSPSAHSPIATARTKSR